MMQSKRKVMNIPLMGLGTWELKGKECTDVVVLALQCGYRHIDTAHIYQNHKAIGKAIADFDRRELFITSKFPLEEIDSAKIDASVEKTCDTALKDLGTDYLDLYLIHWPRETVSMAIVFKAMEKLIQKGKILHAGVSNFSVRSLQELRKQGCHPTANQVEFHPYLYQKKLWDYCLDQQIQLIAYRPLGKKKLLTDALFKRIGSQHEKSSAQIILRWLVQKNIPVIPKSSSKKHLLENLDIFNFSLSKEEMRELDHLNQNKRFCGEGDPAFDD